MLNTLMKILHEYATSIKNAICQGGSLNLKAIKGIYLTSLFCLDLCYYLTRKRCYRSENRASRVTRCRCKLR